MANISWCAQVIGGLSVLAAFGAYMFGSSLSEARESARGEVIRQLRVEGMLDWIKDEINGVIPGMVTSAAETYMASGVQADLDEAARKVIEKMQQTDVNDILVGRLIHVETGNITVSSGSIPKGSGRRAFTEQVQFRHAFAEPPTIALGLHYIDSPSASVRVSAEALDIREGGFTAEVYTWNTNSLHRAEISYVAVGRRAGF